MFAFLAAHRSELFPEEMFADLFPSRRGRPSVPAEVMASVITLQALHGLSDNETVDAVTFDLRWKAACGLPITATAFHSTTLTYWRRRLAASGQPNRIFDAVKAVVTASGALAGKTRRALDSTVLDDAVATQDTVTQLIAAIRRVRREVPAAAEVIAAHCDAHDYGDPGKPAIAWNDKAARDRLVDGLVSDAHRLLGHLPDQELGPGGAEAVALLALIAGQDVEPVEGSDGTDGHWRIAQNVAGDRVVSTVDPEARHAHKTVHRRQDGFKAHIAVEPDTGIITACALTKASGTDNHEAVVGLSLLDGEDTPVRVLGDSAYGTGAARAALAEAGHVAVIKPVPLRTPVPGGFTSEDFTIDFTARTVTCPASHTISITPSGGVKFEKYCRTCPLAPRCTTAAHGRKLTLSLYEPLLRAARADARDPGWQAEYRQHRPMVERSIAWLTRHHRKVRYRGIAKNNHWLHHRAAALNLRRLITMGLTHSGRAWAIT
jgi:IS5 family transposase